MDCNYTPPPAYYYEMVDPYRDKNGLITQKDFDGGDSAHRTGVYYFGLYLNYKDDPKVIVKIKKDFETDLNKLKTDKAGEFVRNPDKSMWYSSPKNFSRDQTTNLITSMGFLLEDKTPIKENLKNIISNYGFYPNILKNWTNKEKVFPLDYKDFAGMSDYGSYIRALDYSLLYPVLLFFDVQLVGSSIFRVYFSYADPEDSSDDINFSIHLLQSELKYPTPLSKLAKLIYKSKKRNPFYSKENDVFSYWSYYFNNSGRPPIHKVFYCPIQKYFYDRE
jgi:hypothetical protein